MGYKLSSSIANNLFREIFFKYEVYAPKKFIKQGRYSDTDIIRYTKIQNIDEIEFNAKSDYCAKEVLTPINETLFLFFLIMNLLKIRPNKNQSYCLQDLAILTQYKFKVKFMKKTESFPTFTFLKLKII